ncbi:MAG: hypothetical protein AAF628_37225 [Planctomycetota bacterium]
MVKVKTKSCGTYPATEPDYLPADLTDLMEAAEGLAVNNSYGRYHVAFDRTGTVLDPPIEVTIECVPHYRAASEVAGHNRGILVLADVIEEAAKLSPPRYLDRDYDLVAVFSAYDLKESSPSAYGRFAWMPSNRAFGAGVFHEWGHAFGAAHAEVIPWKDSLQCGVELQSTPCYPNTCVNDSATSCTPACAILKITGSQPTGEPKFQPCPPPTDDFDPACGYGDMYDYMGVQATAFGGVPVLPRVNPDYIPQFFAPEDQMHVHPVRKLQQGWLDDADINVVSGTGTAQYLLADYSQLPVIGAPPRVHAVEIPRRVVTVTKNDSQCLGSQDVDFAESYWVWWRAHEPMLTDGVSISVASRRRVRVGTRTLEFEDDLPFAPAQLLDHEDLTLNEGEEFHDPDHRGGITIKCLPSTPSGQPISVTTGATPEDASHIPQVSVTVTPSFPYDGYKNPLLPGDCGDTVTIHAEAIDTAVGCTPGAGIESLVVEVVAGEGTPWCLAQFPVGSPTAGPITEVLHVDPRGKPGEWAPFVIPTVPPKTIRSVLTVRATATTFSVNGRKYVNRAETFFYLNQPDSIPTTSCP